MSMPSLDDFVVAQKSVKPSQVVEFHTNVKNVNWNDVAGFVDLKEALLKQIVWPITHPETFRRLGLTAPAGIVFYFVFIFIIIYI
jgi:transitional endoplasmic reticulum ATPase